MTPREYMLQAEVLFREGVRLLGVDEVGDTVRVTDLVTLQQATTLFAGSVAASSLIGAASAAATAAATGVFPTRRANGR